MVSLHKKSHQKDIMNTKKNITKIAATSMVAATMASNYILPVYAIETDGESQVNEESQLNTKTPAELKVDLTNAETKLAEMKEELDVAETEYNNATAKLEQTKEDLELAERLYEEAKANPVTEEDVAKAEQVVADKKAEVEKAEDELTTAKDAYGKASDAYNQAVLALDELKVAYAAAEEAYSNAKKTETEATENVKTAETEKE